MLLSVVTRGKSALAVLDTETGAAEIEVEWPSEHAGFSIDRAHRYVAQTRQQHGVKDEVVIHDRQTGQTRQITNLNTEAIAEFPPIEFERFEIERGGLVIESWLLKPAGFDPAKRYPLVIDIHGGPSWWWGYRFENLHQMLTSRGIAVLYVNPRGSMSYGGDFAQANIDDWGGEDYLDLMDSVDEALTRPWIDPARTGVYGYSYGGFMTSWVIGQTGRFKAAAIGAPVSDLITFFGTSDVGHCWIPTQFGGTPWEQRERFLKHSPITHMHKATTPSLILASEGDIRCPIGQSEQIFATLKTIGVEAEFVRYPGGSHGMPWGGHPFYMTDFYDRVTNWFVQRLG